MHDAMNDIGRGRDRELHGSLDCPACGNPFASPPRNSKGIDLSFSHIPKILPGCLHTVCQSCAEAALQRSAVDGALPCPACEIPTTGVSTSGSLTSNVIMLQRLRLRSTLCDLCHDAHQASHHCAECRARICPFHVRAHTRSQGTEDHDVVPLRSQRARVALHRTGEPIPVACPCNPGIQAKLFCSSPCRVLACYECSIARHAGHTIHLANSDEVATTCRAGLARNMVDARHRLAMVQGAKEAIEASKAGLVQSTRVAENAIAQTFAGLRRALDRREKTLIQHLRGSEDCKTQELQTRRDVLDSTTLSYKAALNTACQCLDTLKGDQLLAMEPVLSKCFRQNEAKFSSVPLKPPEDTFLDFTFDRHVVSALRACVSRIGCLRSPAINDQEAAGHSKGHEQPEDEGHPPRWDVHFTLAAVNGKPPHHAASGTPSEEIVIDIRSGSEENFMSKGVEGPVIARVILRTKLDASQEQAVQSAHIFESLSRSSRLHASRPQPDEVPTMRFTRTLRVSSRR